jgi:Domain of unknown function (DUF1906)
MAIPNLDDVVVESAPKDSLGFDVSHPISLEQAKKAFESGFSFCIRYVPRLELSLEPVEEPDITFDEANDILDSGLALFLVQHVSRGGWSATANKGMRFGKNAAIYARQCGFPNGVNIFLDLEEVSSDSTADQIKEFCNEWFDAVEDVGYEAGVYIGSKNGLNAEQLFVGTKFRYYWHAASQADPPKPRLNDRGYQLFQPLNLTNIQRQKLTNVTLIDKKGLGINPAFEIDLDFDMINIEDVDINYVVKDQRGSTPKWIRRPK